MRLFEALTIALAGQVVLAVAVMGGPRPRWMNLLPLACLAPLAAHVLLEGPRWQMGPAYVVALTCVVAGIVSYRRAPGVGDMLTRVAGFAGILLLVGSVLLVMTNGPR
jgi:hypothetical protein